MSELLHVVCPHCDAVNRIPAERLEARPKCGQCGQPLFLGEPLALTGAMGADDIIRWAQGH